MACCGVSAYCASRHPARACQALYLAFALLALAVMLQGWLAREQHQATQMDAEVLALVGQQQLLIPQVGHALALLGDAEPKAHQGAGRGSWRPCWPAPHLRPWPWTRC